MTRFARFLAVGLALAGLSTNASPIDAESHDLAKRTTSLKCGWAKKDGVDLGCMCSIPGLSLDLDVDFGGFPILDLFLGSKRYPPGCRPTCDDRVYECPHGSDGRGGCKEPVRCGLNQYDSYGKCCPYGTQNTEGICCPKNCIKRNGKCRINKPDRPNKPEPPQCKENEELNKKMNKCRCKPHFEYFKDKCVMECAKDMRRNDEGHCVCRQEHFKPDEHMVCRPQCGHEEVLDKKKNVCVRCEYGVEHGKCKPKPVPTCTHEQVLDTKKNVCVDCEYGVEHGKCKPKPTCPKPKKLADDKKTCICPEHMKTDEHGNCFTPPQCHEPKKLSHDMKSCVCPEHMKTDERGNCFTPPQCHEPKVLSKDMKSCVCPEHMMTDEHGNCFTPPQCHDPMVLSKDKKSCVCKPGTEADHYAPGGCKAKPEVPECHDPMVLSKDKKSCVCKPGTEADHYAPGGCKAKPEVLECHDPMVLSKDKKSCVCKPGTEADHSAPGGCKPKSQGCGDGKKWCTTMCCRNDQEEKNGMCVCPGGKKEGLLGRCPTVELLGIGL